MCACMCCRCACAMTSAGLQAPPPPPHPHHRCPRVHADWRPDCLAAAPAARHRHAGRRAAHEEHSLVRSGCFPPKVGCADAGGRAGNHLPALRVRCREFWQACFWVTHPPWLPAVVVLMVGGGRCPDNHHPARRGACGIVDGLSVVFSKCSSSTRGDLAVWVWSWGGGACAAGQRVATWRVPLPRGAVLT